MQRRIKINHVERISPKRLKINGQAWEHVRARKPWACAVSGEAIRSGDNVYARVNAPNDTRRIRASSVAGWVLAAGALE